MENKEKKRLISFSKLNKYFIIPFISPVLNAILNQSDKHIFQKKKIPFKNLEFFLLNYDFMSVLLGNGIPFLISLCLQKENREKDDEKLKYNNASIELIYYNELDEKKGKQFMFIILMTLLYSSTDIFVRFGINSKYHGLETKFPRILFVFLWSKLMLKTQIFHHHYFSLLICFIGFILTAIPTFKEITKNDILYNFSLIAYSFVYSIFLVLIKYTTSYHYISPYLCLSYIGLFSYIIAIIAFSIYSLIKFHNFSYIVDAFDFSVVEDKIQFYLCSISAFILFSITQTLFTFIIYFFSPNLYMVTEILANILISAVNDYENDDNIISNMIVKYLGYFIFFFATLIINEIIILNFCGLNKFTISSINERQNEEKRQLEDRFSENDYHNSNTRTFSINSINAQNE